jgi:hypothetical protein
LRAITPEAATTETDPQVLQPETVADLNAKSLQTIQSAVAVETTAVPATELETAETAMTSASIETTAPASANSAL